MADSRLTHVDESGRVRMVDVSGKEVTDRLARARGEILMQADTVRLITGNRIAKGNVIETARLAGIMAAKRTADLIPLCHPLNLTAVDLEFEIAEDRVRVWAEARISARTGVEMEALTSVTAALLTIYDMCKAVDREMVLSEVRLIEKKGGSRNWPGPGASVRGPEGRRGLGAERGEFLCNVGRPRMPDIGHRCRRSRLVSKSASASGGPLPRVSGRLNPAGLRPSATPPSGCGGGFPPADRSASGDRREAHPRSRTPGGLAGSALPAYRGRAAARGLPGTAGTPRCAVPSPCANAGSAKYSMSIQVSV